MDSRNVTTSCWWKLDLEIVDNERFTCCQRTCLGFYLQCFLCESWKIILVQIRTIYSRKLWLNVRKCCISGFQHVQNYKHMKSLNIFFAYFILCGWWKLNYSCGARFIEAADWLDMKCSENSSYYCSLIVQKVQLH